MLSYTFDSAASWKAVVPLAPFSEPPVLLWATRGGGCSHMAGDRPGAAAHYRVELCGLSWAFFIKRERVLKTA